MMPLGIQSQRKSGTHYFQFISNDFFFKNQNQMFCVKIQENKGTHHMFTYFMKPKHEKEPFIEKKM